MQNKKLSALIILVVAVLAGSSAVYAGQDAEKTAEQAREQALIQARSQATMERLSELDSKIELLKKRLEIKKLESEIEETKAEQPQVEPFGSGNQFKQFQLPGPPPEEAEEKSFPREEKRRERAATEGDFEDFISQARVIAVNGFGKKLQAKIELPEGGSLTVEEGRDYGRLGMVKSISHNNIVLKKSGKKYFVPFSDKFNGEDSNSEIPDYADSLGLAPEMMN